MESWKVVGFDTFAGEYYPISGSHRSEASGRRAAESALREIQKLQPEETSGGPDGIQDWVFLVDPEGRYHRVE